MSAERGEGSNDWEAAGAGSSNGWPNGLQQPLQMEGRGLGEAPAFCISTPSVTSGSSSDLDTESTGSFFREKSTTLGSLIGLRSASQSDPRQALVPVPGMVESERRSSMVGAGTGSLRTRTAWCPKFGCGRGSNWEALGMSPSLAHLLEEERKAAGSHKQGSNDNKEGERAEYEECVGSTSTLVHRNTLFDEEGILPPHPSGAPLRLILQLSSPSSSYLSADWNVFNGRHSHRPRFEGGGGGGGGGRPSYAKISTFWPNLCGSEAIG